MRSLRVREQVMYTIFCQCCRRECDEETYRTICPFCAGPLDFRYPFSPMPSAKSSDQLNSMWRYRNLLPVCASSKIVTLEEGSTPLQMARSYPEAEVYFKNESLNPTGSHKDRALSIGLTKALEFGFDTVMLYSDGSTALSSAAYAARAGVKNISVVPRGTPSYRVLPLMTYNSAVLEYDGTAQEALEWVNEACQTLGIYETSTYRRANPYEAEGPKTISHEIFGQLGRSPDWVVVPVGGGGTLAGIWRGFAELKACGVIKRCPRLVAVLPECYTVLETALERDIQSESELRALALAKPPQTIQAKIAMSCPPDGLEVVRALRDSGGLIAYSSDDEVLAAQEKLGGSEGIYAEPSAAAAVAALEKLLQMKKIQPREAVVTIITGSGFRETGANADRRPVTTMSVDRSSGLCLLKKLCAK